MLLRYCSAGWNGYSAPSTALVRRRLDNIILVVFSVAVYTRTVVLLIIGIAMSTTAKVALRGHSAGRCVTAAGSVLQIGLVSAGGWLHPWAGIGQPTVVILFVVWQRGRACHTRSIVVVTVIMTLREAAAAGPLL